MDDHLSHAGRRWRDRAEEVRERAAEMHDVKTRDQMLKIAEGYDHLAALADARQIRA